MGAACASERNFGNVSNTALCGAVVCVSSGIAHECLLASSTLNAYFETVTPAYSLSLCDVFCLLSLCGRCLA
jgi:hypothetical protein